MTPRRPSIDDPADPDGIDDPGIAREWRALTDRLDRLSVERRRELLLDLAERACLALAQQPAEASVRRNDLVRISTLCQLAAVNLDRH